MPKRVFAFSLALFAIFIVLHACTKNKYTKHLVLSLFGILFACAYLFVYNNIHFSKISDYCEKEHINFIGRIVDKQSTSTGAVCYTVKSQKVDGKKDSSLNLYFYSGNDYELNDTIEARGEIKRFSKKSNYIYYYSQGIDGYLSSDSVFSYNGTFADPVLTLRKAVTDRAEKLYSYSEFKIVSAMGLGDKSFLDAKTKENFQNAGISHALVVSGLHTGIIVFVLSTIASFLPIDKKIKNLILSFAVFIFMAFMKFSPSVVRAGVLCIAFLIGKNCLLETDNYTVLAVIVLISLIINPYNAVNVSLLLSYSAYIGVINALEFSQKHKLTKLLTAFCISVFAVTFSLPVLAMSNMQIMALSPFVNIILAPIISSVCALSFFTPLLDFVPVINFFNRLILVRANGLLIKLLVKFTEFSSEKLSFSIIDISGDLAKILIFALFISILVCVLQTENKRLRFILPVCFTVLTTVCYNIYNYNTVNVLCFDSGSNSSFYVESKTSDCLIITEAVKANTLNKIINKNADKVDLLIYCSEKDDLPDYLYNICENVTVVQDTVHIENDLLSFESDINNKKKKYFFDISGVIFGFSFNKTDLTDDLCDFYFFGTDAPSDFAAVNSYCFYPVKKSCKDLVEKHDSVILYDSLNIKINRKSGKYQIAEDVKNFGSQFQVN